MVLSPKLTATKKTALLLLLVSLAAPFILTIQLGKAEPKTITVPYEHRTITVPNGNATEDDIGISNTILAGRNPFMIHFSIDSISVEPPESTSPSPTPPPSPTPTTSPTDLKPLPTTLLVAVAILAIVFGFGLIVNLVAGKQEEKSRKPSIVRLV